MGKKVDQSVVPEICKKYREGATLKELAKQVGVSAPTISKLLKDSGEVVRGKGRRKVEKKTSSYADLVRDKIMQKMHTPKEVEEVTKTPIVRVV